MGLNTELRVLYLYGLYTHTYNAFITALLIRTLLYSKSWTLSISGDWVISNIRSGTSEGDHNQLEYLLSALKKRDCSLGRSNRKRCWMALTSRQTRSQMQNIVVHGWPGILAQYGPYGRRDTMGTGRLVTSVNTSSKRSVVARRRNDTPLPQQLNMPVK